MGIYILALLSESYITLQIALKNYTELYRETYRKVERINVWRIIENNIQRNTFREKHSEVYIFFYLSCRRKKLVVFIWNSEIFNNLKGQKTIKQRIKEINICWRGILFLYIVCAFSVIACGWPNFSIKSSCLYLIKESNL